ncbi:MAG TPA: SpoIIE family protein phosphatase [Roseiflexaceae bacterium]|nr:SpoIIE family protein phosphatase [Roseiflexaceae bacterium]HMP38863.1 SpoIIE family protein phosphatase [Roseiflexaceae bacterium]
MFELQVAVVKTPHAGQSESGDTVELIERPGGGFSVVLVNGHGSGRGAKTLSNMIVTRAIAQLKDGARDGVVARAAHDYLYTYRAGQVAATLNIVSVDFRSSSILITRNNPAPFYVIDTAGIRLHAEPSTPIGLHPATRPRITEIPLHPYTYVIVFSEGLVRAGEQHGLDTELDNFLAGRCDIGLGSADDLAEAILARAIEADRGQPADDMSVVVLAVLPGDSDARIRRMTISVPVARLADTDQRATDDEDLG